MDRKSIVVLVVSLGLILLWSQLTDKIWPPAPKKAGTNVVAALTNQAFAVTNPPVPAPTNTAVAVPAAPETPEEVLRIENSDAIYSFTSRGGGIKVVDLKEYPATVTRHKEERFRHGYASVNTHAPVPIMALTSSDSIRSDDAYQIKATGSVVTAERVYPNGLRVTKIFRLQSNYLVAASVRLQNQSASPLTLPSLEWAIGTSSPATRTEDETALGVYWSKGDADQQVDAAWFANRSFGCIPGTPRSLYVGGLNNVAWGAAHNQFFAVALIPKTPAYQILARQVALPLPSAGQSALETTNAWLFSTNDLKNPAQLAAKLARGETPLAKFVQDRLSPEALSQLQAGPTFNPQTLVNELNRLIAQPGFYLDNRPLFAQLDLSVRTRRLIEDQPRGENLPRLHALLLREAFAADFHPAATGYQAALSYPPLTLAPQQLVEQEFNIYAGPREYHTLSRLGTDLKTNLEAIMGYSGFFGFFAKLLLLSMNGLHALGLSYALAIIAITVIIKLLFWPLTNASTKSMKRMSALQPEMKKLQEKYKDDPAKMNRKLMEFMKENKVSPLGGCLPMVLQLPVFFGFFRMIKSAIELRGAPFLWVADLSKPDTLFMIPGTGFPFNLLPLFMGVTMLWQARLTPPSPGMDPTQQKIMRYMPLMFLAILYNFSAGLTLYWTVQNLLTIAQMKLTKARDPVSPSASPAAKARPGLSPRKKN